MSYDEDFKDALATALVPVLHNAARVLQHEPRYSPFFTYFLAYPKTGVSPFEVVSGGAIRPGGLLHDVVDVPEASFESPRIRLLLLQRVVAGTFGLWPTINDGPIDLSGLGSLVSLEEISTFVEHNFRDYKVAITEMTLMGKPLRAVVFKTFAIRLYRLREAVRLLLEHDYKRAGAVLGLLSPTEDVGAWKKTIVEGVVYGR